jgi:Amino acid permease
MKEYESRSVLRKLPVDHIEEGRGREPRRPPRQAARALPAHRDRRRRHHRRRHLFPRRLVAHGDQDNPGVGPSVLIAFLIAGLASAAAALSYAEFAGMIPRAGSAYTYGYVALGEVVGWFIGWDLLLEYIAIVAVVAIGISGYLEAFLNGFGVELPLAITASAEDGGLVNIPAMLICLLVTFILGRGAMAFGRFELIVVALKILLILFHHWVGRLLHQQCQLRPLHAVRLRPGTHRRRDRVLRRLRI